MRRIGAGQAGNSSVDGSGGAAKTFRWAFPAACVGGVGAVVAALAIPYAAPPLWAGVALDYFCFWLFDIGLKGLILLFIAAWVTRTGVLAHSPGAQVAWWNVGLLSFLLILLGANLFERIQILPTPNEIAVLSFWYSANSAQAASSGIPHAPPSGPAALEEIVSAAFTGVGPEALAATAIFWAGFSLAAAFAALWIFGATSRLWELWRGLRAARAVIAAASPADARIRKIAERAAKRIPCRPFPVRIAAAGAISGPALFGGFVGNSPVALLPSDAPAWSARRLYCTLLHEAAHVKRRDWFLRILTQIVADFYWFLPLPTGAAATRQFAADMACDETVVQLRFTRRNYANALRKAFADSREYANQAASGGVRPVLLRMADVAGDRPTVWRASRQRMERVVHSAPVRRFSTFMAAGAASLLVVVPTLSWNGLSPWGTVTKPLLIPLTRSPDGSIRAQREEYWRDTIWTNVHVHVNPQGRCRLATHMRVEQRFFGFSIKTQAFFLDRQRRVIFYTRYTTRGIDGKWDVSSDVGNERMSWCGDILPPRVMQDAAYVAIVNWHSGPSLLTRWFLSNFAAWNQPPGLCSFTLDNQAAKDACSERTR